MVAKGCPGVRSVSGNDERAELAPDCLQATTQPTFTGLLRSLPTELGD